MPRWRDRKCSGCGDVTYTASKAKMCIPCQRAEKKTKDEQEEIRLATEWGYKIISGPIYNEHNHRCYTVLTPCGHEWTLPYNNLRKQVKNAQSKNLRPACGTCGPKHRFSKALEKYVEKHGVDYDLSKANEYRKKVRSLTNTTYKNNKHIINPKNLPRGRNSGYHVDHKVPIIECFKRGWSPEKAASVDNLQMLSWTDNLSKSSKLLVR